MRWITTKATTPSGKTLFVCLYCARSSPTPDKVCPNGTKCHEFEQRDLEIRTHPILKNLLLSTKEICKKIAGRSTNAAKYRMLREHREATRRYIQHAVYMALKDEPFQSRHKVWEVLDSLKDELWKI